jgi:hypothetical protein
MSTCAKTRVLFKRQADILALAAQWTIAVQNREFFPDTENGEWGV